MMVSVVGATHYGIISTTQERGNLTNVNMFSLESSSIFTKMTFYQILSNNNKHVMTTGFNVIGFNVTSKIPVRWPGQCYGFTLSLIFKYCGGIGLY